MCGRFALVSPSERLQRYFGYGDDPWLLPRPVVMPTEPIAIIRQGAPRAAATTSFGLALWGFIPGFVSKPDEFRPIVNARSEDIEERASVRGAIRRRRCIVPADGFYLPQTPFRTEPERCWARRRDGEPLGLAGLWETWAGADGSEIDTACIVTVRASEDLPYQDRMPAIISRDALPVWLDADELQYRKALALLRPATMGVLETVTAEALLAS